jgi:hypothetical protein
LDVDATSVASRSTPKRNPHAFIALCRRCPLASPKYVENNLSKERIEEYLSGADTDRRPRLLPLINEVFA